MIKRQIRQGSIVQFPHGEKGSISFSLKRNAFNIFVNPEEEIWTFDLEGRPTGCYVEGKSIRRTLDNRFLLKSRQLIGLEVFRSVTPIPNNEVEPYLKRSHKYLREYGDQLPVEFQPVAEKILHWTMKRLVEQRAHFHAIYKPISILPPDQYLALVLQITEGCNYNQCTFCNFYRDRKFHIKTKTEILEHFTAVRKFMGDGLAMRRSIFLGDANALVIPQLRLVEAFEAVRDHFPELPNIYSFIDVFTGIKKTADDFHHLQQLGLRRVYIGIETGSPELLTFLKKPQLDNHLHWLIHSIKRGKVSVGLIFLAGIGGDKYAPGHVRESIRLVRDLPIDHHDIVYVSEYYDTNPEYREQCEKEGINSLSFSETRTQAHRLRSGFKRVLPPRVKVSVYDIQQFLY